MCLLICIMAACASHSSRTNLAGLGSQLINCCINKTQVWPSHDELHCVNELNSCIKERKQRKSMQENFLSQIVSISHRSGQWGERLLHGEMVFVIDKTILVYTWGLKPTKKQKAQYCSPRHSRLWLAQSPDSGLGDTLIQIPAAPLRSHEIGQTIQSSLSFSYLKNRDNNRTNILVLLGRLDAME